MPGCFRLDFHCFDARLSGNARGYVEVRFVGFRAGTYLVSGRPSAALLVCGSGVVVAEFVWDRHDRSVLRGSICGRGLVRNAKRQVVVWERRQAICVGVIHLREARTSRAWQGVVLCFGFFPGGCVGRKKGLIDWLGLTRGTLNLTRKWDGHIGCTAHDVRH